jgi:3-dehydroquinate synthase
MGAALAFGLVRRFGRPLAKRLAGEEELSRMHELADRYGVFLLALMRPIPVFAEASVLFMGVARLDWRRFLVAVCLSNLGIAAAYSALGDRVRLTIALAASLAVPLLAALVARLVWRGSKTSP